LPNSGKWRSTSTTGKVRVRGLVQDMQDSTRNEDTVKRLSLSILLFSLALIGLLITPAQAAGGSLTAPATEYVGSQYVTLTATANISFSEVGTTWSPSTWDAVGCTASISGSFRTPSNPQHVEGSCAAGGTINGYLSTGTATFYVSDGSTLVLKDTATPPVTPPAPSPAPVWNVTETGNQTTVFKVVIQNVGNAAGSYNYRTAYVTPASLANISAPAFTSCAYNYYVIRGIRHNSIGFNCNGAYVAVGQTVTIVVQP